MKLKNIEIISKTKLIDFQILKSKIYKKEIEHLNIKFYLKKMAKIIYEYHVNNKNILFLNFPTEIKNEIDLLINETKHCCLAFEDWHNGIITNTKSILIKNKINLVLVFNQNLKCHFNKLREIVSLHVPLILIDNDLSKHISEYDYKVSGNFDFSEKQPINNLFVGIIGSVLKRASVNRTLSGISFRKKRRKWKKK